MARMFPTEPPPGSPRSEKRVFAALEAGLDDSWSVFYDIAVNISPARVNHRCGDSQLDFIVAHPEHGLAILEVKGGGVHYDESHNRWYGKPYGQPAFAYETPPPQQLDRAERLFRTWLLDRPLWTIDSRKNGNLYPARVLVLPDTSIDGPLTPSLPRERIIGDVDLDEIEKSIRAAMSYERSRRLSSELVKDLSVALKPRSAPTRLVNQLRAGKAEFTTLTERQIAAVRIMRAAPRLAISGCAGSGKTMIAIERARDFASGGLRTLFLCYNALLAEHLQARVGDIANLTVTTVHRFARAQAQLAGVEAALETDDDVASTLIAASDAINLSDKYDVVIVDEGQDFAYDWWLALAAYTKDEHAARYCVFYDDNQIVNLQGNSVPIDELQMVPVVLDQNCRNTTEIHQHAMKFWRGTELPKPSGVEGKKVRVVRKLAEQSRSEALENILNDILDSSAGITPESVIVLSARPNDKGDLPHGTKVGRWALSPASAPGVIRRESIRRFKGLESDIVIVTELEAATDSELIALAYVASTRARLVLVHLGTSQELKRLTESQESVRPQAIG